MSSSPKTVPTQKSVSDYLESIASNKRRIDAQNATERIRALTGVNPVMWGPAIVGFGSYHYRYDSGREGDSPKIGLSGRKAALVFYGLQHSAESLELLQELGPHTTGVSCVYVKGFDQLDLDVFDRLVLLGWES